MKRLTVGIAGASGILFGIRRLEVLRAIPDLETPPALGKGAVVTRRLETDRTRKKAKQCRRPGCPGQSSSNPS